MGFIRDAFKAGYETTERLGPTAAKAAGSKVLGHVGKSAGKEISRSAGRFGNIGKYYGAGMAAAIPIGAGAAIYNQHPVQGAINNFEDMAFYDPYLEDAGIQGRDVDNMILGRDIRFGDIFDLPLVNDPRKWNVGGLPSMRQLEDAFAPQNISNLASYNKVQDKTLALAANKYDTEYARAYGNDAPYRGGGSDPYWDQAFGIPYTDDGVNNSMTRGGAASGDIVFGMYNKRR